MHAVEVVYPSLSLPQRAPLASRSRLSAVQFELVTIAMGIAAADNMEWRRVIRYAITGGICLALVSWQYLSQKAKHEMLAAHGRIVQFHSLSVSSGVAHFSFETDGGHLIESFRKCGDCKDYSSAWVIYLPEDPDVYELSFDYDRYFPTWRVFFFYGLYLPIMFFGLNGLFNFLRHVASYFKRGMRSSRPDPSSRNVNL
ncbi:MAG: hypothetical protein JNL05_05950 [Flavobacteriales bacterium]|nr:hypothetical protein [Flavobacteriales bacterium]